MGFLDLSLLACLYYLLNWGKLGVLVNRVQMTSAMLAHFKTDELCDIYPHLSFVCCQDVHKLFKRHHEVNLLIRQGVCFAEHVNHWSLFIYLSLIMPPSLYYIISYTCFAVLSVPPLCTCMYIWFWLCFPIEPQQWNPKSRKPIALWTWWPFNAQCELLRRAIKRRYRSIENVALLFPYCPLPLCL